MNVLVVDDERLLRWSLERLFTKYNIDVIAVETGEEACTVLEHSYFDWLITDLRLPGISGFDVLRFAKKMYPQIHCLVISAFGSEEMRKELESIGIDLYLDKPFSMDFLLETIRKTEIKPVDDKKQVPENRLPKLLSLL